MSYFLLHSVDYFTQSQLFTMQAPNSLYTKYVDIVHEILCTKNHAQHIK